MKLATVAAYVKANWDFLLILRILKMSIELNRNLLSIIFRFCFLTPMLWNIWNLVKNLSNTWLSIQFIENWSSSILNQLQINVSADFVLKIQTIFVWFLVVRSKVCDFVCDKWVQLQKLILHQRPARASDLQTKKAQKGELYHIKNCNS